MFYTSYGNIKKDNRKCKPSSDTDVLKINQTKEKASNIINIISKHHNLEDVNKKILIKLINQDIDSYYDIFEKSDKGFYSKNLLAEKISEKSLKIEINRLLHLIINKSNFYITPQIKSKNTNVIPQKEGGIDVTLQVAIRSLISLGEKVSNEHFLEFNDKIMLIESSLIRLHHAYHIFENSEQKDADLHKLKNTRKLIAASVQMGIILEYGYFKNWQDGFEQTAVSLIKPFRFKNQVLKIKRKEDILYYLLPSYKNYKKCIYEENIKDINKINEQVNISLLKIFSQKDNKDEFYQNCQEFTPEEQKERKSIDEINFEVLAKNILMKSIKLIIFEDLKGKDYADIKNLVILYIQERIRREIVDVTGEPNYQYLSEGRKKELDNISDHIINSFFPDNTIFTIVKNINSVIQSEIAFGNNVTVNNLPSLIKQVLKDLEQYDAEGEKFFMKVYQENLSKIIETIKNKKVIEKYQNVNFTKNSTSGVFYQANGKITRY